MRYYIDTCIWLETLEDGKNARIARRFLAHNPFAVYSDIVVRELCLKIGLARTQYILEPFLNVETIPNDKKTARTLESQYSFQMSFYDFLHLTISKRANLLLVTRDATLIKIAREQGVTTFRPEELPF